MNSKYFHSALICCGVGLFGTGCGYKRVYSGPKLPSAEVSRIIVNPFLEHQFQRKTQFTVEKINGIAVHGDRLEVKPGECTLEVSMFGDRGSQTAHSSEDVILKFHAISGRIYEVGGTAFYYDGTWSVYVRDRYHSGFRKESRDNKIILKEKRRQPVYPY
jgi:hypothetical protein